MSTQTRVFQPEEPYPTTLINPEPRTLDTDIELLKSDVLPHPYAGHSYLGDFPPDSEALNPKPYTAFTSHDNSRV